MNEIILVEPDNIIDDNEQKIDLTCTPKLREWLLKKYQNREVVIADDGQVVTFTGEGLKASVKRRGIAQRQIYSVLESLLKNSIYRDYELADERHKRIERQKIYYARAKLGSEILSVRFKIDIPKGSARGIYKDHKIENL